MSTPDPAWWISWYSHAPRSTFELHSPWWISGYDAEDREIICAAVRAPSEDAAWELIRSSYDDPPEHLDERFIEEAPEPEWSPFSDRFPKAEWMAWDGATTCACSAHTTEGDPSDG